MNGRALGHASVKKAVKIFVHAGTFFIPSRPRIVWSNYYVANNLLNAILFVRIPKDRGFPCTKDFYFFDSSVDSFCDF